MVKGVGFIDELHWEGGTTFGVHIIYVGLDAVNSHTPELYGGMDVTGLAPDATQTVFDSTLETALKNQLVANHGFVFNIGDVVRILGVRLSAGL